MTYTLVRKESSTARYLLPCFLPSRSRSTFQDVICNVPPEDGGSTAAQDDVSLSACLVVTTAYSDIDLSPSLVVTTAVKVPDNIVTGEMLGQRPVAQWSIYN